MIKKVVSYFLFLIRYIIYIKCNRRIISDGFVRIQANVKIIVEKEASLVLGKNILIKHDSVIFVKSNAVLKIGNNSSTGHHTEISVGESVEIGDDVIMAAYTYITDSNHVYDKNSLIRLSGMQTSSVKIGSNIWLGRSCQILSGVVLGDKIVVAAGAVVTKSYDGNVILGGIPAKEIKRLK